MKKSLFFVFSLALIVSCQNKPGCRDGSALNHDITADVSDNSCIYESSGVIYWDENAYDYQMTDSGSVTIYAYLDGKLIGSKPAVNYQSGSVNCNLSSAMSFHDTIYYENEVRRLLVKDEQDHIFCNYDVIVHAGCNTIEILD